MLETFAAKYTKAALMADGIVLAFVVMLLLNWKFAFVTNVSAFDVNPRRPSLKLVFRSE